MQKIRIDFDNPGLPQHISAVENDSQSRFFQATLYENGKAYTAPEGATYSIMYRGFGPQNQGWYDTINDGAGKRAACAVSGNVVTCEIARQALQVPGHVSIVLCVTTGKGYMLKSWPIECDCKNDRYDSTAEIQSFFCITQVSNADWTQAIQAWEDLKNTIDPTLSVSGKAADAAKVGTSLAEETTRAKAAEEENAKGIGQLKEDVVDLKDGKLNGNATTDKNLTINSEVHEGYFTNGNYPNSDYLYFLINASEGQTFYIHSNARYIANYTEKKLLAENQKNSFISPITGTLAFTFGKEDDIAIATTNDFSNIPFYATPYYTVNLLHQTIGNDNKKPMSQAATTIEVNSINDFVLSGKKEINNQSTNDGTYVILDSSVVYNPSYRLTPAFKFDYDVLVSATGNNIRYGEFNSADRNDLHKSYVNGVPFPLLLKKEYYHRFSYDEGTNFSLFALINSTGTSESALTGKTVYNFGDSLMYGHYSGEGILDGLCAETGALLTKYAINGATVLGSTGLYNIENQVKGASEATPDFVIFDGLMNDDSMQPNYTTKLGTLSDSFDETSLNIETFYGAFEHLLYTIRTKYTNTNMIFVCCHKTPSREYNAQEILQKAVRECCEKWSVPYVDIYTSGQINCYFDNLRTLYSYDNDGETSGGNGTHLTGEGYNKFYAPIIKAKMIELIN